MKIFLPSQAKVFGNVSGEARIPTKREERLPSDIPIHLLRSPWKYHIALRKSQLKRITHEFNDLKYIKIQRRINPTDKILRRRGVHCSKRTKYHRYYLVSTVLQCLKLYWFRCSVIAPRASFSECSEQVPCGFIEQP